MLVLYHSDKRFLGNFFLIRKLQFFRRVFPVKCLMTVIAIFRKRKLTNEHYPLLLTNILNFLSNAHKFLKYKLNKTLKFTLHFARL